MATSRRKRPDLETKEELLEYLEKSPNSELPFLEELWEISVKACENNKNKQQKTIVKITTDSDGNVTETKSGVGNVITNPVKQYFKMASLPQYRKRAQELKDQIEIEYQREFGDSKRDVVDTYFADSDTAPDLSDEIIGWINLFNHEEKDFMVKRYSSYFDQYEINEGADKTSLKRILSLEIALHRIDNKRASGKPVDINDEKKLSDLLQSTFESLKWTKKQRNAREDMAQNKFTVWMEKQVQEGGFTIEKKTYEKDEIDFLIDTIIDSTREMLS